MTVSDRILDFYASIKPPNGLPSEVVTMNPYSDTKAMDLARSFYSKYYSDQNQRTVLFGINPGRFGGGITGVPFTDPIRLEKYCKIQNDLDKKQELSSVFIYEMISTYGTPEGFYSEFYLSAISPLGFTKDGKNLNYYDIKDYKTLFEQYVVSCIQTQCNLPLNRSIAYCIGQGQNLKFFNYLNEKYQFFNRIEVLPHPRWVMQYKLKSKDIFIEDYIQKLSKS